MRVWLITLLLLTTPAYAASQTFIVIVSGIGGEPLYSERFRQWSETMLKTAETRLRIARDHIVYLSESPEAASVRVDGRSSKEELAVALSRLGATSRPGDVVLLLLIGHGSLRRDEALFNLPGPDVSARELDDMLRSLSGRRLVVVNGAPSSAPFLRALSAPDRVIITATASTAERYHTIFIDHFVAAFTGDGADMDKNGQVSMLEAFEYANREVQRSYDNDGRLQTEHALLDDNADGQGSRQIGAEAPDGTLARTLYLQTPSALALAGDKPSVARLLKERGVIEQRIEALKARKAELEPQAYENQLEALLIELALTHRALRAIGGSQ
jgi:hypothetical protein